ncbi:uracil phosphoribosyltransferase, chloroplastic-like [Setaria italica]|uniref:uracil phosphoribosyltransferase, chloroplastic-like n=1 Tax=Setaria italica TaxID=4555 RepID=UPI000BE54E9A|nr:uracil phosphoribosyltransferase, chloroplastic-like [Setaria italica]
MPPAAAWLYIECVSWQPTVAREVQTPLGPAAVQSIDDTQPIMNVPILRAGLAFAEQVTSILPSARIFHLGMSRNEETLLPSIYLNKLPAKFPDGCHIFLMDPMLATGGTMAAAVNLIEDHGANIEQITVTSAITCPPAIENLRQLFPGYVTNTKTPVLHPNIAYWHWFQYCLKLS